MQFWLPQTPPLWHASSISAKIDVYRATCTAYLGLNCVIKVWVFEKDMHLTCAILTRASSNKTLSAVCAAPTDCLPAGPSAWQSVCSLYNLSVYNLFVYNPSVHNPSVYNLSVYNLPVYNLSVYNLSVNSLFVYDLSVYNLSVYNLSVYNLTVYNLSVYNLYVYNLSVYNLSVYNLPVYDLSIYNLFVYNLRVQRLLLSVLYLSLENQLKWSLHNMQIYTWLAPQRKSRTFN